MELTKVCYVWTVLSFLLFQCLNEGSSQETSFELPVQLVGFPFIILAVRLTNFIKKLSYALSPSTYRSRNRRHLDYSEAAEPFDAAEVEKYIVGEFGAKACVFERVCAHYATRATTKPRPQLDWPQVFSSVIDHASHTCFLYSKSQKDPKLLTCVKRDDIVWQYKRSSDQAKEFYLLSVFMGDIVGSPLLCHQLGKRRGCDDNLLGN